jgi:hypothetical protein
MGGRKGAGSTPDEGTDLFLYSRIMAPGFAQPVTEMNTGRFLGRKTQPACKANNLTSICEPTGLHGLLYG